MGLPIAPSEGLIQIGWGRSSPLRGALRASKTLARFFELELSSSSRTRKTKKGTLSAGTIASFWERLIQIAFGRSSPLRGACGV